MGWIDLVLDQKGPSGVGGLLHLPDIGDHTGHGCDLLHYVTHGMQRIIARRLHNGFDESCLHCRRIRYVGMCPHPETDGRQNRVVEAVLAGSVADQGEPLFKAQLRPLGLAFDPSGALCTLSDRSNTAFLR